MLQKKKKIAIVEEKKVSRIFSNQTRIHFLILSKITLITNNAF